MAFGTRASSDRGEPTNGWDAGENFPFKPGMMSGEACLNLFEAAETWILHVFCIYASVMKRVEWFVREQEGFPFDHR